MGQDSQRRSAHPAAERVKNQDLIAELFCGDDVRAEQAAISLGNQGEKAFRAVQPYLNADQSDERWWAVRALAQISHPEVTGLLVSALHDSELSVRQCAALALRQRPFAAGIPVLVQTLSSPDPLLRRLASEALIANGEPAVLPLLEVMENGQQLARLEAARALAKIGDQRAIPALFAAWGEDSAMLEYWANEGLDRMGAGMVYFYP